MNFIKKYLTITFFALGILFFSIGTICNAMEEKPKLSPMTKQPTSLRLKGALATAKNILADIDHNKNELAKAKLERLPIELQEYVNLLIENNLDLTKALWKAIANPGVYSLDIIQDLIKASADKINEFASEDISLIIPNASGFTLLCYAIMRNLPEIVSLLLENGADIEQIAHNYTPLLWSILGDSPELVTILLKRGAKVNQISYNMTPLIFAILTSIKHVYDLQGADASTDFNEIQKILTLEEVINVQSNPKQFTITIIMSEPTHVDYLNDKLQTIGNYSLINVRTIINNTKIIKLLLDHKADVNLSDENGYTPLIKAAEFGASEIVTLLLNRGAAIDKQTHDGTTALMLASEYGFLKTVELLLNRGASINHRNQEGTTALILAAKYGFLDTVALLLQKGANVNIQEYTGATALILAAGFGFPEIINLLLEKGASINHQDQDGVTALMNAAEYGALDAIEVLLARDANKNITDNNGKTALDFAREYGHLAIEELLES
jgi:ankyrin repeat protein